MNVKIISVGKVKDRHLNAKIEELVTRTRRFAKVTLVELKDSVPAKEGSALCDCLKRENGYKFVLSEEGVTYSSLQFADRISALQRDLVFVIGGPFGLAPAVKDMADEVLSLSPMTFVHEMAKLLLIEQIYRAFTILNNGHYHK